MGSAIFKYMEEDENSTFEFNFDKNFILSLFTGPTLLIFYQFVQEILLLLLCMKVRNALISINTGKFFFDCDRACRWMELTMRRT